MGILHAVVFKLFYYNYFIIIILYYYNYFILIILNKHILFHSLSIISSALPLSSTFTLVSLLFTL